MKRNIALLIVFLSILGTGCTQQHKNQSATSLSFSYDSSVSSSESFYSQEENNQDNNNEQIQLISGTNFSEGNALIEYYIGTEGKTNLGVLSIDGSIIPVDNDGISYSYKSKFSNGYAYYNYAPGNSNYSHHGFGIVNCSGEKIFNSEDDADYEVVCGEGNWYLVKKKIRTMDTSEDLYGIIESNGNWKMKPQADLLLGKQDIDKKGKKGASDYRYLGNGYFAVSYEAGYNKWYNVILNAKDKQIIDMPASNLSVIGTCNGFVIGAIDGFGGGIYRINNDTSSDLIFSFDDYSYVICSENLIFNVDIKGRNPYFIDTDGNVVLDLSSYSINTNYYLKAIDFQNGYSSVIFQGADNNSYLMIIDNKGSCKFEPLQVNSAGKYIDGYVGCFIPNLGSSWVDENGNVSPCTFPEEILDGSSVTSYTQLYFYNGYAYVPYNDSAPCYVSKTGEKMTLYIQ